MADSSSDEDDVPLGARMDTLKRPMPAIVKTEKRAKVKTESDSDSDDDLPLATRMAKLPVPEVDALAMKKALKKKKKKKLKKSKGDKNMKKLSSTRVILNSDSNALKAKASKSAQLKKKKALAKSGAGAEKTGAKGKAKSMTKLKNRRLALNNKDKNKWMWTTLQHWGVIFPPEYTPHGVKMLYEGKAVDLTPEQEEIMTAFAMMRETEYLKKPTFIKNAWNAMKKVLGKDHAIKRLDKCDFTPIWEWHLAEKEKKKQLTKEEKKAIKEEKEQVEAKYKFCEVDERREQVGNFRVEPPGLFRGRGEHPKMGMWKRRVYPEEITINIGEGADVPECPVPGHKWGRVQHDHTVTWLACWNDPINTRDLKYVFLAANSQFKADSDLAKYERARKLKDYIEIIRKDYMKGLKSKDRIKRQMACATYLIDRLALRAGHEKEEDEADTVGCCTLKVSNVEMLDIEEDNKHRVKFDFLGKDSIRYENVVEIDELVYNNMKVFSQQSVAKKAKKPEDLLFDGMTATDINGLFKCYMPGLSAKVFRTYNASITLGNLLKEGSTQGKYFVKPVEEKKADYDRANKEVAILCNHQRSVPKGHAGSMEKLDEKLKDLLKEFKDLKEDYKKAKLGEHLDSKGKPVAPEKVKVKLDRTQQRLKKLKLQKAVKEDLKTVALGTSKINYMDPRITVAWCKKHEVPIEKIFNKSLLSKFHWAMTAEPDFEF
jgi:DNA topoisomerase-1